MKCALGKILLGNGLRLTFTKFSLHENYFVANGIKSDKKRLANLKHLGGARLCDLLKLLPPMEIDPNCTVSIVKDKEFKQAIRRLDDYFESRVNPAYFVLKFKEMRQAPDKNAKQFALKLKDMSNKCEFVDVEEQVKNQLMWGSHDRQLKRLLARRKHVDLNEIIEEAQLYESLRFLDKIDTEPVNYGSGIQCYKCKKYGHPKYNFCLLPFKKSVCFLCNKPGHIKKDCFLNKARKVRKEIINEIESDVEENTDYVFFMDGGNKVDCLIGGIQMSLIVDSR